MINKQNYITVCTASYMHYALTLLESIEMHNKDFTLTIFISDIKVQDLDFSTDDYNFNIICIDELFTIIDTDIDLFLSYYNVLEFNSMLKIYALYYATEVLNYDKCTFLDPDMYMFKSFDNMFDDSVSVYVSPHICSMKGFDSYPSQLELVYSGIINGGIIHINKSSASKSALQWLISKTKYYWFVAPEIGMYADQLWLSVLPMIDRKNVKIIDSMAYNIAYWNLYERPLYEKNGKIILTKTNETLGLFHFSGFPSPYNGKLSNHFTGKYDQETEKVIKKLSEEYDLAMKRAQEKIKALKLSPSIYFINEAKLIRLQKAEKIWNINYGIGSIPSVFEKIGRKLDGLFRKILK